jgi:carbamate kinase
VDKDYTAQRIATVIGARRLVLLTDVEGVALSFGGAQQQFLRAMTIGDAREHASRGEFAPGSMGPKVEAAIDFLEASGEEARIASVAAAADALAGRGGTRITG